MLGQEKLTELSKSLPKQAEEALALDSTGSIIVVARSYTHKRISGVSIESHRFGASVLKGKQI